MSTSVPTPAGREAPRAPTRILIVGGGYVGMYTALRLMRRRRRQLRRGEVQVTVVDTRSYMTYQPFLPEVAAGSVEPRHVVVPLRRVLRRCEVITAEVTRIEHARRTAYVAAHSPALGRGAALARAAAQGAGQGNERRGAADGQGSEPGAPCDGGAQSREIRYDHVVVAPGAIARTLPIPGLADVGIGFKRVEESIFLRNHVIDQLDVAASIGDPALRRCALTFVFVGGGYAGVEALAELEDMARYAATRDYATLTPEDLRWVLVEAAGRILPEVDEDMGRYTLLQLRKRGIEVKLNTRLVSAVGGRIVLSDGTEMDSNTLVWTAGVKPHPLLDNTDLPRDGKGRLRVTAKLTVDGVQGAWAAGDCAAVPDLTRPGQDTGPSAQHAVRQAGRLADNLAATLRGRRLKDYRHAYAGSVASLGLHKGVAQVYGIKLRGWIAWFMHRTYHLSRVPTLNRKIRILGDWTLALFFRREVVSLGSLQHPRQEFLAYAARPSREAGRQAREPSEGSRRR